MAISSDKIDRSSLPIPDRPRTGLITYDAKDPDPSFPIEPLRVPNVLIVLLDDIGFAAPRFYGRSWGEASVNLRHHE
jgi:arylsulfatase